MGDNIRRQVRPVRGIQVRLELHTVGSAADRSPVQRDLSVGKNQRADLRRISMDPGDLPAGECVERQVGVDRLDDEVAVVVCRGPVVVDPRRAFGAPVVARTGIRTADIFQRFAAGEPVAELADDYGLSIDKVEAAIRAEARFLEPIAA